MKLESYILIFADDTSLLASGNDLAEAADIINRDLKNGHTYGELLHLNIFHKIHMNKTRSIIWNCMPKKGFGSYTLSKIKL